MNMRVKLQSVPARIGINLTILKVLDHENSILRAGALAAMLSAISVICVPAQAIAKGTSVCDLAAHKAAREFGVPYPVLWSITRTETGRSKNGNLTPWPWTVNLEGKGFWFDSMLAAQDFALRHHELGARSFDIGCFQINYRWHGASFRSIEQMFDPYENARYAASFLARLYRETGNWSRAAGIYHSRTPEYARIYRARFDRIKGAFRHDETLLTEAHAGPASSPDRSARSLTNSFPLLRRGEAVGGKGSLVPLGRTHAGSFISLPADLGGS